MTRCFKLRPLKKDGFCSKSRKTKNQAGGILNVFRGLDFSSDKEFGQRAAFCRGLMPVLWGLALILMAAALPACTFIEVNLGPKTAPLLERTLMGEGEAKVLLVDISGVMLTGKPGRSIFFQGGEDMVTRLAEELDRAAEDPDIKALLVRIDSPGGAVTVADQMHHLLLRHKSKTKTKLVACLMGVAASGGYYVALAADRIVAQPTTVTGSIGVISLQLNVSGLMGKLGVKAEAVKSAPLKDMWSPFKPATDEERRIMQELIDELFTRFKTVVRQGRPGMTPEQYKQAVTARVFTAGQALKLGLVDGLAYPEEAFEAAKEMAGVTEAKLVTYHRPGAYRPNIYAGDPMGLFRGRVQDFPYLAGTPQLMYLWLPGIQ